MEWELVVFKPHPQKIMKKQTKTKFNKLPEEGKWELYEEAVNSYNELQRELNGVNFSLRNIKSNYVALKDSEADLRIKYKRLGNNLREVLNFTDEARVQEKQLRLRKAEVDKILKLL